MLQTVRTSGNSARNWQSFRNFWLKSNQSQILKIANTGCNRGKISKTRPHAEKRDREERTGSGVIGWNRIGIEAVESGSFLDDGSIYGRDRSFPAIRLIPGRGIGGKSIARNVSSPRRGEGVQEKRVGSARMALGKLHFGSTQSVAGNNSRFRSFPSSLSLARLLACSRVRRANLPDHSNGITLSRAYVRRPGGRL